MARPGPLVGLGILGALMLRRGAPQARAAILARFHIEAQRWLGMDERSLTVQRLVSDYTRAWQWLEVPTVGNMPDWCGLWALEIVREAMGLPAWPLGLFKAPLPLHPWGAWYGSVGDIKDVASQRGMLVSSPEPGDLYALGSTHVGLVRSVSDGTMTTYDGNWSNAVGSRTTTTADKQFYRWLL